MTRDRDTVVVPTPTGGWEYPWQNVAELASVLGPRHWTLVGGLMVQLHAQVRGMALTRTTVDVDLMVHIETSVQRVSMLASALRMRGYELQQPTDPRGGIAHRFVRPRAAARAVVGSSGPDDVVDALTADHAAPRTRQTLQGHPMVEVPGGTQALLRTVNAELEIDGSAFVVSVPNVLGALMLKAAAHRTDSRSPMRHLQDAVTLLVCVDDPLVMRSDLTSGGDHARVLHLSRALGDTSHPAWLTLQEPERGQAQLALAMLAADH